MGSISSDLPECRGGSFLHIDVVLPHKSLQGFEKNIIKHFCWVGICVQSFVETTLKLACPVTLLTATSYKSSFKTLKIFGGEKSCHSMSTQPNILQTFLFKREKERKENNIFAN